MLQLNPLIFFAALSTRALAATVTKNLVISNVNLSPDGFSRSYVHLRNAGHIRLSGLQDCCCWRYLPRPSHYGEQGEYHIVLSS